MRYKVSVIIPVYNNEKYLRQCLDSVIRQTLKDIEIVCVNDGSTDKSLNIMEEYQRSDARLKIIDKVNSGYGDSLNVGITIAKGEYIAIVESDDFIELDMLESLYKYGIVNDLEIVRSNYYEFSDEYGDKMVSLTNDALYDTMVVPADYADMFIGEIYLWTSLYRKSFLDENNIRFNTTPGASFQDVSFTFKALACADRLMSVDRAFYHYRQDNPNSSVKSKEKVYCICDEFDEIKNFCNRRSDIKIKMEKIVPYMLFKRYMGTYWRIDGKFKPDFLLKLKSDLTRFTQEELNKEIWSLKDWEMYLRLDEKCVEDYSREQMRQFMEEAFLNQLRGKEIYIYGAGKIGKKVRNWLYSRKIDIECFLTTSGESDSQIGVPVRKYIDIKNEISDDDCILVAVGDKLQVEIVTFLLQQGRKNTIAMTNEMRRILDVL